MPKKVVTFPIKDPDPFLSNPTNFSGRETWILTRMSQEVSKWLVDGL